jgi:hypothetical protein
MSYALHRVREKDTERHKIVGLRVGCLVMGHAP